jgi:hypothetical protein
MAYVKERSFFAKRRAKIMETPRPINSGSDGEQEPEDKNSATSPAIQTMMGLSESTTYDQESASQAVKGLAGQIGFDYSNIIFEIRRLKDRNDILSNENNQLRSDKRILIDRLKHGYIRSILLTLGSALLTFGLQEAITGTLKFGLLLSISGAILMLTGIIEHIKRGHNDI